MSSTRGAHRLVAAASVIALLGGCGGAPSGTRPGPDPTTGGSGVSAPATETFTSPPTEDPDATETPEGGGDGEVAINLPGLPIGGFHEVNPSDPTVRCVVINWSGPPDAVPPEVNLEVTGITVEPATAYTWSTGGCGAFGPCLDSPGVFDAGGQCGVRVDQVAAAPEGTGVLQVVSGAITCEPDAAAACEEFSAAVRAAPPDHVEWDDALTKWVSSDEPTTGSSDPTDTSDPTGTSDTTGTSDSTGATG